jgi:hypothetical protein
MSLSPEVIEARIRVHIATMKLLAAQTLMRRNGPECFPVALPPAQSRRPRPEHQPFLRRGSGGDGHLP